MDIKILDSWLREFLETDAKPKQIRDSLALCGPSVEKVEKYGQDWLYDIEITTNRVDMMSVYGIAREAAVILPQFGFKAKLKPLNVETRLIASLPKKTLPLKIETQEGLTHRVMAMVMDHVQLGPSPQWIKERLEAAGIRSLNNVIDMTNYVMTEIGHPCHVFDYDKIKGHLLRFRLSKKGESMTTLDGKQYQLPGGDIVIEDTSGEIVDLPGIMGTKNSVVNANTKRIILFIDNNNAKLMRQTSMTLGIRTVAVTLNEKRVDPELGETAIMRGIQLYQKLTGATLASKLHDLYTDKPKSQTISTSLQFIEERMGVELKPDFVKHTLEGLGFKTKIKKEPNAKYQSLHTTVPTWRTHDVAIPEDIVEEVARIYGYHNLPSLLVTGDFPEPNPQENRFYWEKRVKYMLKNWGFYENYTYSLVSQELLEKAGEKPDQYLQLKNPLTVDWLYLRQSLIPSILQSLANNQDRAEELKFFEMANKYLPRPHDLPNEVMTLILAQSGKKFLEIKGVLEVLAKNLGIELSFQAVEKDPNPLFNTNIQAHIVLNDQVVGIIGEIGQDIQENFGLKKVITVAEINNDALTIAANKNKKYVPLPKYPPIVENYTFYNQKQVPATRIIETGESLDSIIQSVKVMGFYENKINLEVVYLDKKKNLTTENVTPIRRKFVAAIERLGTKLEGEV